MKLFSADLPGKLTESMKLRKIQFRNSDTWSFHYKIRKLLVVLLFDNDKFIILLV